MIDSKIENENYQLTINFNPIAMKLLRDSQKKYEQLFNKPISYEDVILKALFFTKNINTMKLAILKSYEQNETIIHDDTKPLSDKKGAIAKESTKDRQARLGGF